MSATSLIRELAPPLAKRWLQRAFYRYGWSGNFQTWEAAARRCSGYASEVILQRVTDATAKVQSGQARYERDSVLFSEPEYSWPLLAGLMHVAAVRRGCLNILDFGGALGSSYFQCRPFLYGLEQVRWCIVEQAHFVEAGRSRFQSSELRFYTTIRECVANEAVDAVLFSSVLQYLPDPYDLITNVICLNFDHIIVDRTSFVNGGPSRISIQRVDPKIYPASYPCHFFAKEEFLAAFSRQYDVVAEFAALDRTVYAGHFSGFIFRRKHLGGTIGRREDM